MRALAFALLFFLAMIKGCSPRQERIPPSPDPIRTDSKLIVYQLTVRLFGNKTSVNKSFGTIEENGVGKFNDISPLALEAIKDLGATHIWYTGVIEHPTLTDYSSYGIPNDDPDVVKGRAGFPYTIKDYYDVDPDLAVEVPNRMREFEQLIERTHRAGLKAIIDFVPNHVARRYHSDAKPEGVKDLGANDDPTKGFAPTNNFYYLPGKKFQPPADHFRRFRAAFPGMDGRFDEDPAKATGDDKFVETPPADSWFEAVKLNYGVDYQDGRKSYFDPVPDTWSKMRDILLFWADKKVDGFRCDMAEMVPVEFWRWAVPQVKAVNPEITFIAEIYNPRRYRDYVEQGRFDFLYDKVQLYDTLRLMVNGKARAQDITRIRLANNDLGPHLLHFLENHDEQRIASDFFAVNPFKALPAMLISATIDNGPVMIYFGQEVGEPGKGSEGFSQDDGRTPMSDYWGVPEHQKWMNGGAFDGGLLSDDQKNLRRAYRSILRAVREHEAIRSGEGYLPLTVKNESTGAINDRIVAYGRLAISQSDDGEEKVSERLLILAGFNPREESLAIQLADSTSRAAIRAISIENLLGDTSQVTVDKQYVLHTSLPAFGTRILKWKYVTDN